MAIFNLGSMVATDYSLSTGNHAGAGGFGPTVYVTDNDPGDSEFDTSESLTYGFGTFSTPAEYVGTTLIGGQSYLVIKVPLSDIYYVVGIVLDAATYPDLTSLNLNTSNFSACFGKGTLIDTPTGRQTVDNLAIGDRILNLDADECVVKWIGHQTIHKFFTGQKAQAVRIAKGALGTDQPDRELTVTADHGMVFDGLVINASALVNGTTIDFVPLANLADRVTYYHIETEAHDVILANGAPAETYVDIPGRMAFDNYQEYVDLYGAERIVPEMDRPRITSRRLLPDAIKARLGIADEPIDFDTPLNAHGKTHAGFLR